MSAWSSRTPSAVARPSFHDRRRRPSGRRRPLEHGRRRRPMRRRGSARHRGPGPGRRTRPSPGPHPPARRSPGRSRPPAPCRHGRAGAAATAAPAARPAPPRVARPRPPSGQPEPLGQLAVAREPGERIVRPSQLPPSDTPYAAENSAASGPSTSRTSAARPGERGALVPVGVRVLAGREAAVGRPQLAEQVVERACRRGQVPGVRRQRPGVQVHARQLGVVVEHLLEVRDEPRGVGCVAVEPAAELVADATGRHRVQAPPRNRKRSRVPRRRVPAEEGLDRHRLGELGRPSPAAVDGVEGSLDGRGGTGPATSAGRQAVHRGTARLPLRQRLDQPGARPQDLVPLLRPCEPDRVQDLPERRHAVARRVREVGAAVERAAVRRQEHAHRPAALPRQRLDRAHVDLVQVRALLAVHLDRDEVGVEQRGRAPRPRTTPAP